MKNNFFGFLLAALQIQTMVNEPTAGEMEDALEALPHTLQDAFVETLAKFRVNTTVEGDLA